MSLYAYAVYLREMEYPDEDGAGRLVNQELVSVWATEHQAEEEADVLNLDGVGALTSRIAAVVVPVEVGEKYHEMLWRAR